MQNFSFVVSEQEANVIIGALAKLPFEVVAPLIQKLQAQATKQQNDKEVMQTVADSVNTK
jgi:hypothetical protein